MIMPTIYFCILLLIDIYTTSDHLYRTIQTWLFGPYTIRASEVFCESPLSLGFVNLKPVVPGAQTTEPQSAPPTRCHPPERSPPRAGHVLFMPKRVARRVADLSPAELQDLWARAAARATQAGQTRAR